MPKPADKSTSMKPPASLEPEAIDGDEGGSYEPTSPIVLSEPAKPKAKAAGHTVCRITGGAVVYHGQFIPEGTVGEFEDAIVLDMPKVFVSLE